MPLPRFRLRTLILAVAAVAVLLGGEGLRRRRAYCLRQAATCNRAIESLRPMAIDSPHVGDFVTVGSSSGRPITPDDLISEMEDLKAAYLRVAARPWLPLPP